MERTRLYKGGKQSPLLLPIDAEDWKRLGWSESPDDEPVTANDPVDSVISEPDNIDIDKTQAISARKAELEAMDWRGQKEAANAAEIVDKPDGGWDEAIPEILAYEFGL